MTETKKQPAEQDLKTKGTELEPESAWCRHFYLQLPEQSRGWTRYIRDFFTCLEFLTRIRITKRQGWFPDEFARSVKFFSIIGLIYGLWMMAAVYLERWLHLPLILSSVLLLAAELLLGGSLMYDGFMDTCDGIFSGRTRARRLEIMQDSHVGANAVLGIILLLLLKVSFYAALPPVLLPEILLTLYITTRTLMVIYIVFFPNARPGGLGAMFKQGAAKKSAAAALLIGAALIYGAGPLYLLPAGITLLLGIMTAFYLSSNLGGLTGDTFGALTECGGLFFLFSAWILNYHNILR